MRWYVTREQRSELSETVEYLLIAVSIPLFCVFLIHILSLSPQNPLHLVLFGIEAMSPALAAVITISANRGAVGLANFLKSKYIFNSSLKLCVIAFLAPMAVLTAAKILSVFLTHNTENIVALPSIKKTLIILWALVAEELGWRGFLQERIENRFGTHLTPLFVGAVWGAWHFHYFLSGVMDVPFFALMLGCIFESCGYFTITKLTGGNIIPASIWHFSGNLFISLYMLSPSDNGGNTWPYLIMTFMCVFYVIVFAVCSWRKKSRL